MVGFIILLVIVWHIINLKGDTPVK
jgi:hypothetical protein